MTILMYHKVFLDSQTMWWVFVDEFYRQMLELRYRKVVYLDEYNPKDPNQVVITFDGIYKNILDYAVPILRNFNYRFELFISSDYIGIDNSFDQPEPLSKFVTLEELELLVNMNGRLQWHTKSHPDLTEEKDISKIIFELEVPLVLKKLDPKGFNWFAYPYGNFNQIVVEEVKKRFRGALSCHQGNDTNIYCLNRITVTNETIFKKATISVIIASYNYGSFLVEAIESVLRQTRMPDEILITDDASEDNTYEIAEFYRSKYPHLIKVNRNQENLGIVKHFNKAISLTNSDYITFLGADNRYRSDFIEKTSLVLDEYSDVAIVYSDFALFGSRAKVVYDSFPEHQRGSIKGDSFFIVNFPDFNDTAKHELLTKANFIHGSSMYRRQAFDEVGGYIDQANLPEDYNLFLRIVKAGWNALRVPFPILEYRQHSKSQENVRQATFAELQFYKQLSQALHQQIQQLSWQLQVAQTASSIIQVDSSFVEKSSTFKRIDYSSVPKLITEIDRPLWSVMIPAYNNIKYLEHTLKSVLEQAPTSELMQIEVVDDCSTEGNVEEIVHLVGKGRVDFYRQPKNLGLIGNWNACIQRARGYWVHILHQDDIVMPGFYNRLQASLEKETSIGAAFCRHSYIDKNSNWLFLSLLERETSGILSNWLELIATMQRVQFPAIVVRRSTYEELGGFCSEAGSAADWEMWKRIAAHYPIWYEPQILACFRLHSASESSRLNVTGTNIADTRKAIDISQFYLPEKTAADLSAKAREYYAFDALSRARQMLDNQDIAAAIALIREGLKCSNSSQVMASLASLLTISEANPLLHLFGSFLLSTEKQQLVACVSKKDEGDLYEEFNFKDINLIIFPDWEQPEELLYEDLTYIIKTVINNNNCSDICLLIYNSSTSDEDANFIISDVTFNLVQQGDLDITDHDPVISLISNLSERQSKVILEKLHARIILSSQDEKIITKVGADKIFALEVQELKNFLLDQFNL
ncbi:glycosyltransferase [Nostoc sp. CHAB 5836]|uniref:glycosyltransferase n=1 Tax=Nostoc sp. CHAB 5836 TaxID=2780404 RepID=UPI001E440D50|nr:glycosyltransferase [Nostoc sp. CHAB 5836]MCC5613934.1 glycosyltransferase [Nostoc sp. CHAB 5836]